MPETGFLQKPRQPRRHPRRRLRVPDAPLRAGQRQEQGAVLYTVRKTKWGSCNHKAGNIRLNTGLVKKPKDVEGDVVVHELVPLLEPSHNSRFITLLYEHYPNG
jgi:predicted metal-dependent hydrolase